MQKHGFGFIVILASAALMTGCSSYNHQRAAEDFIEGATSNAVTNRHNAEQQHRKPDSSLLPDVVNGVLNVGLQWLVSSDDPSN